MSDVAAIILAAGRSTRFIAAQPEIATKLIAPFEGRPLVRHVAEAALAAKARPIVVVTGHASDEVREALAGLPLEFAFNEAFASGLASSLKAGIAAIPSTAAGAIVLLGDMPLVAPAIIDRLCEAFALQPQAAAVVPVGEGRRGNPALLSRRLFPVLAGLSGDQGARKLIDGEPDGVIEIEVEGEATTFDVDTPAPLARARAAD